MLIETCTDAVKVRFRDGETDEIKSVSVSHQDNGRFRVDSVVEGDKLQDRIWWLTPSEMRAMMAAATLLEV